MTKKYFNKLYLIAILAVGLCGFNSCIYDDLPIDGDNDIVLDTDGFTLGFTINLDNISNTRSGEEAYEDYIDTRNKFRVFFFDSNGQFLFEAIDRTIMPKETTDDNGVITKSWYVHIPVNYIVDHKGKNYDVTQLKNQLRTKAFKIAVLANWPEGPQWGYDESIFANYDRAKNINDLHHLKYDSNYNNHDASHNESSDRPTRKECYDFIMDSEGKMGIKVDWVKSRMIETNGTNLGSATEAATWIRENWNPDQSMVGKKQYRDYTDMWYLWDFNAAYQNNPDRLDYPKWKNQWWTRNGSRLHNWLANKLNSQPGYYNETNDPGEFTFNNSTSSRVVTFNGQYGILLGSGSIVFQAQSAGTLRIKASSNATTTSRIHIETRASDDQSTKNMDFSGTTAQYQEWDVSITGEAREVEITGTSGSPVIYSVEYIRAKYLYDSDREAILPSEEQPIPMYGVQNYGALTNWEAGTTYDVSAPTSDTDKEYRGIALIRAVAKVELYVPANGSQELTHVYLRSINRTSRCEPVDVETPTNILWDHLHPDNQFGPSYTNSNRCEWYNIMAYGPYYDGNSEPKDHSQLATYKSKLSWLYGSWTSAKWKSTNGGQSMSGWNFNTNCTTSASGRPGSWAPQSQPYPHIFNSDINRSDYCSMIRVPSDRNGYIKYLMYVPDKNIDDPNYVGIYSSIPKVAHIEFRYADMDEYNLDDNECYRVYFTNYNDANNPIKGVQKGQYESTYHKNVSNLKTLWPIMRNHVYTFILTGTRSGDMFDVNSQVTTWDGKPVK